MPKQDSTGERLDLLVRRGGTLRVGFYLWKDGAAVSAAGYALRARVWTGKPRDSAVLLELPVYVDNEAGGLVSIALGPSHTAALPCGATAYAAESTREWDLQATAPSGDVDYPRAGLFRVAP